MTLEELKPGASVRAVAQDSIVSVVATHWYASNAIELTYMPADAAMGRRLCSGKAA